MKEFFAALAEITPKQWAIALADLDHFVPSGWRCLWVQTCLTESVFVIIEHRRRPLKWDCIGFAFELGVFHKARIKARHPFFIRIRRGQIGNRQNDIFFDQREKVDRKQHRNVWRLARVRGRQRLGRRLFVVVA